jgi:hypothetical protein
MEMNNVHTDNTVPTIEFDEYLFDVSADDVTQTSSKTTSHKKT